MVTFRFYIVSTVAFFLALAVGVVVGSVLDEGIVSSLEDRLQRVEQNLDETVASIDEKNREIEQLERYVESSAPFAVEGRLDVTSTLVVAEPGLAEGPVRDLVRRLGEAGSRVEGIVWMDRRWNLEAVDDRQAVASLLDDAPTQRPALRRAVWAELFAVGADPIPPDGDPGAAPADPTTTDPGTADPTTTDPGTADPTTTDPGAADSNRDDSLFSSTLLADLAEIGVLRLETIDDANAVGGQLLLVSVTGAASSMDVPGETAVELVETSSSSAVPTVLTELLPAGEPPSERGAVLSSIPGESAAQFSTVDDLELLAGRVASVLALADAREGRFGRYGLGDGTDGVLPRWQAP